MAQAQKPPISTREASSLSEGVNRAHVQYYGLSGEQVEHMFNTSTVTGLSDAQAAERLTEFGENRLTETPPPSPFKIMVRQLKDLMVGLLILAAVISTAIGDYIEGGVLFLVVVVNVAIGFSQELKAERALHALVGMNVSNAVVLREGDHEAVDATTLVPGDIVSLDEGVMVPADMRIVSCTGLKINEALLTGESLPANKMSETIEFEHTTSSDGKPPNPIPIGDQKNMAFMSTLVVQGHGVGVVTSTGLRTQVGGISLSLTAPREHQPRLKTKLTKMAKVLVGLSVILCLVVIAIGLLRTLGDNGEVTGSDGEAWVKIGIALAVAVIPEGLVTVVTVTMALGVVRMTRRNAIVRELPAVETLGSVTVICTDKTGTLTEGRMTFQTTWSAKELWNITGPIDQPTGEFLRVAPTLQPMPALSIDVPEESSPPFLRRTESAASAGSASTAAATPTPTKKPDEGTAVSPADFPSYMKDLLKVCALCSSSSVEYDNDTKQWVMLGDATETALQLGALKAGLGKEHWLGTSTGSEAGSMEPIGEIMYEIPFDSDRRCMSVVFRGQAGDGSAHCVQGLTKGAVETVLDKCTTIVWPKGGAGQGQGKAVDETECIPLTNAEKTVVLAAMQTMSARGMRVLGLATRQFESNAEFTSDEAKKTVETELSFLGLVGLWDPPRQTVIEAIKVATSAGIRVCMITGDHPRTAQAIASILNILPSTGGPPPSPRPKRRHPKEHNSTPEGALHRRTKSQSAMTGVITGQEVAQMSKSHLLDIEPFPRVFARVSPETKLKVVLTLQERGEVVAMTGDGVNDAPAIKHADCGIAMGKSGTDVTKEAADIILRDDNFATILAAVEEGRITYDNIQKFVIYLLSCNSAKIFVFLAVVIAGLPVPFTTVMILWANLVTDVPPAIALGLDSKEADVMERLPRDPESHVLSAKASIVTVLNGLAMALVCTVTYVYGLFVDDLPEPQLGAHDVTAEGNEAQTMAFMSLALVQLAQGYLGRSISRSSLRLSIFDNKVLNYGIVCSFIVTAAVVYIPAVQDALSLYPLGAAAWLKLVIGTVIYIALVELVKLVVVRRLFRGHSPCLRSPAKAEAARAKHEDVEPARFYKAL